MFDHTNNTNPTSTNGRSIRLSGNANEKTGLAKTLSVMPGDVVNMKVYAKYVAGSTTDWSTALNNLITAIASAQSGTVIDGGGYPTSPSRPFPYTGLNGTGESTGSGPKAYLNYIMFDRDFNPIIGDPSQTWFKQVSPAAKEDGQTHTANGRPHELLEATITAKQAGYLYIYLSNEETSPVEVFFDDFEVEHTKSPVVQSEEYYPFGLTFNGYRREVSQANNHLYNGKEKKDDLNLDLYDYGFRMYNPAIGRWAAPDPIAELRFDLTPFRYCFNSPINYTDPFGLWERDTNGNYSTTDAEDIERFVSYLTIESSALNNNPSIDQINGFIEGEESEDGLGRLSDGSQLVSAVNVKGYSFGNRVEWYKDQKTMDRAWHEVQGSLTPDALDPRTIGKNLFDLTYPGGNNPKTYNGAYDYSYVPSRLSEYPAIGHDRRYDNLKVTGASGLVTDTRTIGADWRFVYEEFAIASTPSLDMKTRVQALTLGLGLGLLSTPKTILTFGLPRPSTGAQVTKWNSIGNAGVTNKPDNPN